MALPIFSPDTPPTLRLIKSATPSGSQSKAELPGDADAKGKGLRQAEVTDAELVGRLRQGEPEAFEALYRRHAGRVLALTIRIQGHGLDVEDIVHDAFLKAQDKIESLRDPTAFGSWICTIAVSLLRSRLRRKRMLSVLGFAGHEEFDIEAVVSSDASPETRSQLSHAYLLLNQLPVEERICWTLRHVDGHKLQEVAQMTQCSLATVKRRISHAQTYLHEQLTIGGNQ